jgi:hypothetical protein
MSTRAVRATVVLLIAATALLAPSDGLARHDRTLHRGNVGADVCALQWLLSGGKPSVYRGLRVYPRKLVRRSGCQFGKRIAASVTRAKVLLGWPKGKRKPVAGRDFLAIIQGKTARPLGYIARAARVKADAVRRNRARLAKLAANSRAGRMIALARRECCGFRETWGRNRGPRVDVYTAVTGTRGLPWCAAFLQWLRRQVGLPVFGRPAPAHVFTIVGAARSRGLLRSVPRPGRWVAFLDRLGHIGMVVTLQRTGFVSIEGNASDGVLARFHPYSNSRPKVYIVQPGTEGVPA